MATKMTINGVSTCQSAGTENYEKLKRVSADANAPLCNTTTATRTGNFSLVSNPH